MNWKTEWNELLIVENIIVRYKKMSDPQQKLDFLYYQRKNISGRLSRVFYELWEAHVQGKDSCDWMALQKDIYLAHRIIQKGASWNALQWEDMERSILQKRPFHTIWGEAFCEILHVKIRQEKKAEKRAKKKIQKKRERKQKRKDTRDKSVYGPTIAAVVLGMVSLAFLSVWLFQTIKSDQSRYRLAEERAEIALSQALEKRARAVSAAADGQGTGMALREETGPSIVSGGTVSGDSIIADAGEKKLQVLDIYQKFLKKHQNLYGWLRIEGTAIDLPVMRPKGKMESDFYLHHSYEGEETAEGALFVDPECRLRPRSQNIVIYGHNMRNGEMFGGLIQYENAEFLSGHSRVEFDTIYETGTYEIIAVLLTRVLNEDEQGFRYYQIFDFKKAQDYEKCQRFINQNLAYGEAVELNKGDELLMLSTCEYSQENGRLVIVARRKEESRKIERSEGG